MFHGVSKEVFKPIDLLKFVSITGQCVQNFTVNHKIFVEAFLQWNQTKYTWDGDTIIADFSQKLYIVFEKVEDLYRIIEIKTKQMENFHLFLFTYLQRNNVMLHYNHTT